MKNLMTMTIAAAAFVAAAGMASAQTMEAKIPFDFSTNGKVLAAGTYRVQLQPTATGNSVVLISSSRSNRRTMTLAFPNGAMRTAWRESANSVLTFRCDANHCALSDIWMGTMGTGVVYELPKSKLSGAAAERAEVIVMYPVTSE